MVKEKVEYDSSKNGDIQKNILHFEQLVVDLIGLFSKSISFCNHSGEFINELIKQLTRNNEEINNKNEDEKQEILQNDSFIHENNANMDNDNDDDMDLIRFTNNGPIFQISKSVLDALKGSFIEEQSNKELRTNDGSIYLDYRGNDGSVYYLVDYLNGKKVDFDSFSYEEQLELLNLFEFCGLVIPLELIDCRERRDRKMKKYKKRDEVSLIINGKKNDIIKKYLVKNGLWNNYVKNYNNGFINYNPIDDNLYMNKKYEYIEYITQYVNDRYIDIEEDMIDDINKKLLEKEMVELFGEEGREAVREAMIGKLNVFMNSTIIEKRSFEIPLVNWLGKEKKWKLLFRASEHNYLASEFHNYCDNKGETVTLIKHIGHNNQINIFGGYTDQSWNSNSGDISPSKEFIFTLSNEHGIPPTKYDHNHHGRGICCSSSCGPIFGQGSDICMHSNCHTTSDQAWTESRSFTTVNTPQKSSLFVNTNNANTRNLFTVEEYEVWGKA
ncbi:hypothetical protein WA158_000541 [Blastocystis sp. Blastoise]